MPDWPENSFDAVLDAVEWLTRDGQGGARERDVYKLLKGQQRWEVEMASQGWIALDMLAR